MRDVLRRMNAVEFLVYGPASLWFLGSVVLFLALVQMLQLRHSKEITSEMQKGRQATNSLQVELQKISSDLQKDTCELGDRTGRLSEQLIILSTIIGSLQRTMRHQFAWMFPYAVGESD